MGKEENKSEVASTGLRNLQITNQAKQIHSRTKLIHTQHDV